MRCRVVMLDCMRGWARRRRSLQKCTFCDSGPYAVGISGPFDAKTCKSASFYALFRAPRGNSCKNAGISGSNAIIGGPRAEYLHFCRNLLQHIVREENRCTFAGILTRKVKNQPAFRSNRSKLCTIDSTVRCAFHLCLKSVMQKKAMRGMEAVFCGVGSRLFARLEAVFLRG